MAGQWDERKAQALQLLLCGVSPAKVADAVGVNRATIGRWRQEPQFIETFEREVSSMASYTTLKMHNIVDKAVGALEKILAIDPTESPAYAQVVLVAIRDVFDRADLRPLVEHWTREKAAVSGSAVGAAGAAQGGVMIVPAMAMDDWQRIAEASQAKLKSEVKD